MKSLYEELAVRDLKARLASLQPDTPRLWGKMTPAQTLAHCSAAMETAIGDKIVPRMFLGRLLGPFVRREFSNDNPLSKNGPTAPSFVIKDDRDFEKERRRLVDLIEVFLRSGPAGCTREPHCFFGELTPDEWGKGMYKHIDHHLKQFGL